MRLLISLPILFTMVLLGSQCQPEKVPQQYLRVEIPRFEAQNAYDHIVTQLDFGPRAPGYPGREACIDWMVDQLKSQDFKVEKQNFNATLHTGEKVKATNVIARYNPNVIERVLLCAHWDTRPLADKDTVRINEPIPGADDGASGVAVIMEIARLLKEHPIPMGIDIVLFDLEDAGSAEGNPFTWGLGSQHWAREAKKKGYEAKYGILLDMVGAKDARFTMEGISMAAIPGLVFKIWRLADGMGRGKYFIPERTGPIIDDHRFIFEILALPVVNIYNKPVDRNFGWYHHTHADDLDVISVETLDAVGQVVTAVIYKESNMDL